MCFFTKRKETRKANLLFRFLTVLSLFLIFLVFVHSLLDPVNIWSYPSEESIVAVISASVTPTDNSNLGPPVSFEVWIVSFPNEWPP